jgi:sterol 3beta-glucosyltransferase
LRVTLLTIGTRGDVQPFIALGVALRQTGRHEVRLIAPENFEPLIRRQELDYWPLGMDVRQLLGTGALAAFTESGKNILVGMWQLLRTIRPLFDRMMENTWLACQEAESIVFSTLGLGAYHVADKLGLPCYWAFPFPAFIRTRALPSMAFPPLRLGGAYNLLTHVLAERFIQLLTTHLLNRWRRERFDLPPLSPFKWPYDQLHGRPVPVLCSFSPLLFPKPPDYGEHVHITGYWFLDQPPDWQPPAGLQDFLDAGPPPVYVGFGSLPQRDPRETTRLVLQALRGAGQRGVIVTGWGGLDGPPHLGDDVFALESVPHAWLFPRMRAVVHQGGSGTTGAGLRAGVPSVIVPHTGDQPLWARRVAELGVGPSPVPRRQLTTERLRAAIASAATDEDMQARAEALGERIRSEGGVGRAIDVIEQGAVL